LKNLRYRPFVFKLPPLVRRTLLRADDQMVPHDQKDSVHV